MQEECGEGERYATAALAAKRASLELDLDHNEGLDFHNAFGIRATHPQRFSAPFNSFFGAFLPNRASFSYQGPRSHS
jgi:hypothetical protein